MATTPVHDRSRLNLRAYIRLMEPKEVRALEPIATAVQLPDDEPVSDGVSCWTTALSISDSSRLQQRIPRGVSGDIHEGFSCIVYLVVVPTSLGQLLIVAAPLPEALAEFRPSDSQKFARCNLVKLCNAHYEVDGFAGYRFDRLHVRIDWDSKRGASSALLYGRDLIGSQALRYLSHGRLPMESVDPDPALMSLSPFKDPMGEPIRRLIPNSCRLVRSNGAGLDRLGINMDAFGNLAFYLSREGDLPFLVQAIEHMDSVSAIETIDADPLRRSPAALEALAK